MSNEYDVFISYSGCDKDWVRGELLDRIEQAGFKAFIDFRDFTRGAPSISECERAVIKCRKTLLVLTPDYIRSEWAESEALMLQTLEPANRGLRLIPLLRTRCKMPLRISSLTYIDFTAAADFELAWSQLLKSLDNQTASKPQAIAGRGGWFLPHTYPMSPNFTGRLAERKMLTDWLESERSDRLFVLRALGGFGKSALAWHWLMNDVQPENWPRIVWWSFYEGDARFDSFLFENLQYLKNNAPQISNLSSAEVLKALLKEIQNAPILIVMDGFERLLRSFGGFEAAYQGDDGDPKSSNRDCISPLATEFLRHVIALPDLRSKVLLTTRLTPRALDAKGGGHLEGCHIEELLQMQPADALAFAIAQGVNGAPVEIAAVCGSCGFHPLSLRLLTGLIVCNFERPGDVSVARQLDVTEDLIQNKHHVLKASFDSLSSKGQVILGRIACFRGSVKYQTLRAVDNIFDAVSFDEALHDLVNRGMVQYYREDRRFDLHPIVRKYAYDRLTAPERSTAHANLMGYFAAVPHPHKVDRLEDLSPVIELYHHTVRAGRHDEAADLFQERLSEPLYDQFGAFSLIIDLVLPLFPEGELRTANRLKPGARAWALSVLANSCCLSGQHSRAIPLFERQILIREKQRNKGNLATGLGALASVAEVPIGRFRSAESNLRRSIALCESIHDETKEADWRSELGRLFAYTGNVVEAESILRKLSVPLHLHIQLRGVIWAYRAIADVQRVRRENLTEPRIIQSILHSSRRALELANETAETLVPCVRDFVRAYWLLGAAHRLVDDLGQSERALHEALERSRQSNLVEFEADILIDLARVCIAASDYEKAQRFLDEAVLITEGSGNVLQRADAHLELAKIAQCRNDRETAIYHSSQARTLATCDGPPNYTYKAAYLEAGNLLELLR